MGTTVFEEIQIKDLKQTNEDPWEFDGTKLYPCNCGGQPILDISMALIYCPQCECSVEYRYNRGVIPYYLWQMLHEKNK